MITPAIKCKILKFLFLVSSAFSTFMPKYIPMLMIIIGKINMRLYKSNSQTAFMNVSLCPNMPKITIYGPLVQGSRNKLTKNPIKNALSGPVMDFTRDFNLGRQLKGTSIKNTFPYQK